LNGSPGYSSSTKLLLIGKNTTSYTTSPRRLPLLCSTYTEKANILSLDQLVNVGFSYSSDGSTTSNSLAAAKDVRAFLELFLTRFPDYAKTDIHIAAESYRPPCSQYRFGHL
jgi:cathepsin A (carboxypeptidase C)